MVAGTNEVVTGEAVPQEGAVQRETHEADRRPPQEQLIQVVTEASRALGARAEQIKKAVEKAAAAFLEARRSELEVLRSEIHNLGVHRATAGTQYYSEENYAKAVERNKRGEDIQEAKKPVTIAPLWQGYAPEQQYSTPHYLMKYDMALPMTYREPVYRYRSEALKEVDRVLGSANRELRAVVSSSQGRATTPARQVERRPRTTDSARRPRANQPMDAVKAQSSLSAEPVTGCSPEAKKALEQGLQNSAQIQGILDKALREGSLITLESALRQVKKIINDYVSHKYGDTVGLSRQALLEIVTPYLESRREELLGNPGRTSSRQSAPSRPARIQQAVSSEQRQSAPVDATQVVAQEKLIAEVLDLDNVLSNVKGSIGAALLSEDPAALEVARNNAMETVSWAALGEGLIEPNEPIDPHVFAKTFNDYLTRRRQALAASADKA